MNIYIIVNNHHPSCIHLSLFPNSNIFLLDYNEVQSAEGSFPRVFLRNVNFNIHGLKKKWDERKKIREERRSGFKWSKTPCLIFYRNPNEMLATHARATEAWKIFCFIYWS